MGRMKQLYIEVEELAASLLMDLGLEPGTVAYDAVYPGVVDRLTQWVDVTFLGAPMLRVLRVLPEEHIHVLCRSELGAWEEVD